MKREFLRRSCGRPSQSGMSLLETIIATAVLIIGAVGVMSVAMVATTTTENQGHLGARTAEYAQDKMEQLMGLAYCDSTTDTTVFPANSSGGTGLGTGLPCPPGSGTYGSSDPNAPVAGYVDYLDNSGNPLGGGAAPAGWYYIRVWQISTPAGTSNLKQVTVTAKVRYGVGTSGAGAPPQATITSLKTSPF